MVLGLHAPRCLPRTPPDVSLRLRGSPGRGLTVGNADKQIPK